MRFLGLTPETVAARSSGVTPLPIQTTPIRSTLFGALMFGSVSVFVFGLWAGTGPALYRIGGELGAYLVWAAAFMVLAGLGLGRLVVGRDNRLRFLACFALAFAAYSAVWMAAWFAFRNRTGEVAGAMGGTAVFAWVICQAFGAPKQWSDTALYLFIGNTVGYFSGDLAHQRLGGHMNDHLGFRRGHGRCQRVRVPDVSDNRGHAAGHIRHVEERGLGIGCE